MAKKIPFIRQLAAVECGASCLAMSLGYFGKHVTIDEVREVLGIDRDGIDALTIARAARWYGLSAQGYKVETAHLSELLPGSILHWNANHFVVFERASKHRVFIVDPELGRRRVPLSEFEASFTGYAVVLSPTETFVPSKKKKGWLAKYSKYLLLDRKRLLGIILLSLVLQLTALALPSLTGLVVDRVIPRRDLTLFHLLVMGSASLLIAHLLAILFRSVLILKLRTEIDLKMTTGFLEHLLKLPFSFFQRRSAGDLMMRLNSNAIIREVLTSGAISSIIDGILVCLYLVLLIALSPRFFVVVAMLGMAQIAVFLAFRSQQRELQAGVLDVQSRSHAYQVEMFTGLETLKGMGAEDRAMETFIERFRAVLGATVAQGRLAAIIDTLLGALRYGSPLLLLLFGAHAALFSNMSLGMVLALCAIGGGFLFPLFNLMSTASQLQMLGAYLERIDDVMVALPEEDSNQVRSAPRLAGHVSVENISFRYSPMAPMILEQVSVEINRGSFVAIVGTSGAGKSTLANLLVGLFRPTNGRVLFDGNDFRELAVRSVRSQIGVVSQHAQLFAGSIRDNIAQTDPKLSLDSVIEAATIAQIHDDIIAMPMGYNTVLVDGGSSISGGQKQRIALARAIVRKPAILLLDEATSALDAITEKKVHDALGDLRCTRIVIAHRLSTIRRADVILVLDEGRIIEKGSFAELLASGGKFSEFFAAQSTVQNSA